MYTKHIIVLIGKFTLHSITLLFKTDGCACRHIKCHSLCLCDTHVLLYSVIISLEITSQTYTTYSEAGLTKSTHHTMYLVQYIHVQAYGDITPQTSATTGKKWCNHKFGETKLNLWTRSCLVKSQSLKSM